MEKFLHCIKIYVYCWNINNHNTNKFFFKNYYKFESSEQATRYRHCFPINWLYRKFFVFHYVYSSQLLIISLTFLREREPGLIKKRKTKKLTFMLDPSGWRNLNMSSSHKRIYLERKCNRNLVCSKTALFIIIIFYSAI